MKTMATKEETMMTLGQMGIVAKKIEEDSIFGPVAEAYVLVKDGYSCYLEWKQRCPVVHFLYNDIVENPGFFSTLAVVVEGAIAIEDGDCSLFCKYMQPWDEVKGDDIWEKAKNAPDTKLLEMVRERLINSAYA